MPTPVQFRDFLDSSGHNTVHEWISGIPVKAKQKMTSLLQHLENEPNWRADKHVKALKGGGKGLLELIFSSNRVLYRPLMYRGPGDSQVTILLGATEQGDRFNPPNAITTALARRTALEQGRSGTVEHDYS